MAESIEEAIKAAIERGEFDHLPGAGKPLPHGDDGPGWWVRQLVARLQAEETEHAWKEALIERLDDAWLLADEVAVRRWVEEVNGEVEGTLLDKLDPAEIVSAWRRMARARR